MLAVFFFVLYSYEKLPVKIVIAKDVSLPYNFFLYLPPKGKPMKGEYVEFVEVFKSPLLKKFKNPVYLIKKVVCTEGDVLRTDGFTFYCNDRFLGVAMGKTPKGKPLKVFEYNGKIPPGYFFVMGTHSYSFDSRYIGLVYESQVTARAIPLW